MLRPRIIPCLLIKDKGLIKTVKFKEGKYVGDPLNAVRIFNEKAVDELMVIDIDATVEGRGPDFELLRKLAIESRMPLCYGGGIKTAEQARRLVSLGIEKVAISSGVHHNMDLLIDMAKAVGSQSVVIVLDVKKKKLFGGYEIYTHNGKKNTKISPFDFIRRLNQYDIGEIVINSIDNDGVMDGYDLDLAEKIRAITDRPMTILGGAGTLDHISNLFKRVGIVGAGAGSLFVFKGKYKAVLINYPSFDDRISIYTSADEK